MLEHERQQPLASSLLEQRVLRRDHEGVGKAAHRCLRQRIEILRPDADPTDDTLIAQGRNRRQPRGECRIRALCRQLGVVQIEHVDAVEAQSLERLIEAATDAVSRVVVAAHVGLRHSEVVLHVVAFNRRDGLEDASDLG